MKGRSRAVAEGSAERVRRHRDGLRKKGLKAKTVWVPDIRDTAFVREYQRQLAAIARSAGTKQAVEAFESIAETRGWV